MELSAEDIVYSGPDPPTLSISRECKIIWSHISESCNGVEEWGVPKWKGRREMRQREGKRVSERRNEGKGRQGEKGGKEWDSIIFS